MDVNVQVDIIIQRPRAVVASYAADPQHAPEWYVNIKSAELKTPGPLRVGSRMAFIAHFLGRRLDYTYEIIELVPDRRLVMRTAEGPFPMETTYVWEDASAGMTRMTLRSRGTASGFSKFLAPFIAGSMRRANRNDLLRLKHLLENRPGS